MALGKPRSNKRPSSATSYTSTITTIIFVALCMLGVWMLTSNSLSPPQTTTRTATKTTPSFSSSSTFHNTDNQLSHKKPPPVFEDNPGGLPTDAIKSDDSKENHEESNATGNEAESNSGDKEEVDQDKNVESENNENEKREESEQENVASKNDNEDVKEQGSVVEENPNGLQGRESEDEKEKQKALETQTSEESSTTHSQIRQHAKEITGTEKSSLSSTHKHSKHEENHHQTRDNQEMSNGNEENLDNKVKEERRTNSHNDDNNENSKDSENEISDEDQRQQVEALVQEQDHEGQHKEQTHHHESHGATSDDQIQHDDEAPLSQETSKTKTKAENHETQDESQQNESENNKSSNQDSNFGFPGGESSSIPKESKESKTAWSTQADQSENQKERRNGGLENQDGSIYGYTWELCNVTAGADYIPCLDNEKAISKLHSRHHYEHRERHCPDEAPTCLVPLPEGYKRPIGWPQSRDKIWYHNVPHTKLAEVKGHQNWVKVTGEFLTFPGGGTQFIHGALHYIDFIQEAVPEIAWGKRTRVILDVGCGVASFGGFLFERDVLAMSFAPKDEHEAQVQFALERGIPAISAVMGTQRLPFPSRVFDVVHCARCRVPWHAEGGALLLELNRVIRPGGYFVWSATPVYQTLEEDVQIWKEMSALTASMCWELVTIKKDTLNSIGAAIYQKPVSNKCYDQRKHKNPPMCKSDDDPNAAWYVPLQSCMHRVPIDETERGSRWPEEWPRRLQTPPYWLNKSQMGIYGKPAPDDFASDYEHWKHVVGKSYLRGLGISWSNVRSVMDMRAVYGGFAAAMRDLKVWVLNVVNIDSPDTLPIIYERGLFGIYHDWCESFSTYPRTYDLLHADHLFSRLKKRCKIVPLVVEIDRIVRPGGTLIVRDESSTIGEVENVLKSMHWEVHLAFSKDQEGLLSAQKSDWRPNSYAITF